MATYKDSNGIEHRVRINLVARRKVLDALKVDFVACAANPDLLLSLLDQLRDGEQLFRMLAIIEGVSFEDLLAAADQETEEAAGAAFIEALSDFFHPSNPLKAGLKQMLQRVREHREKESNPQALMQLLDQVDIGSVLAGSTVPTSGSPESQPSQSQAEATGRN